MVNDQGRGRVQSSLSLSTTEMGRILLTGASGFIAATVLRAYIEAGHIVRFTVRSDEKARQILAANREFESSLEAAIVPGTSQLPHQG